MLAGIVIKAWWTIGLCLVLFCVAVVESRWFEKEDGMVQKGKILFGGEFSIKSQTSPHNTIDNLALFDLDRNTVEPFYKIPPNGRVHVIRYEPRCDFMVMGGNFTTVDGVKTGPIAFKMDVSKGDWSNTTWNSLHAFDSDLHYENWSEGATIMSIVIVYREVMKPCRPLIVMAGQFTKAVGISDVNNVAILNTVDMSWNFLPDGGVNGLVGQYVKAVVYDSEYVYAGGNFKGFLKRYSRSRWETILPGQLDGPVTSIVSQSSHVHKGSLVVGGFFSRPHRHLLKLSPQIINISPSFKRSLRFKELNDTDFSFLDNDKFGVRRIHITQDNLHLFGYFSVVDDNTNAHSYHYLVFNMENGRLLSNNSLTESSIPQCGVPCLAPFNNCRKRSSVLIVREYSSDENGATIPTHYLTIFLQSENHYDASRLELEERSILSFDLVSSVIFMPVPTSP